ncbi:putative uncharacterized protein DDB_G0294196 [Littorina saxatilis]|uniref:putative uncharacterized protein DDB_G0294196 n=1 Tax=Littorina saxatilis TaxID=31220 RepID=UPI0038B425FB
MQAKYDETMREQQSQLEKEDLSDMVAAHAAKQRLGVCKVETRELVKLEMSAPTEQDEDFAGDGDAKANLDQELARKVALQQQMLESERDRQKEALGYQQSLLLQQQQQMTQPVPPPPPQMTQPVAPPPTQPPIQPPPQPIAVAPPQPQQTDLMMKALQQQQMLEAEKQREAQQKRGS